MKAFIDASAIVAILADEKDGEAIAQKLDGLKSMLTSAIVEYEVDTALARTNKLKIKAAIALYRDFAELAGFDCMDITKSVSTEALAAHARFGKGHHKAALNMGDCFSYACAKTYNVPLLFKGNDFASTDIPKV